MWWFVAAALGAEIVERVVAVVDGSPVLEGDVQFERALDELDVAAPPWWSQREPDPLVRVVESLVVRARAERVPLYQPDRRLVIARYEAMRGAYGSAAAWSDLLARLGRQDDEVLLALRRRLIVEAWLRQQVDARVSAEGWLPRADALLDAARAEADVRTLRPMAAGAP
jgi:hypothetical protein